MVVIKESAFPGQDVGVLWKWYCICLNWQLAQHARNIDGMRVKCSIRFFFSLLWAFIKEWFFFSFFFVLLHSALAFYLLENMFVGSFKEIAFGKIVHDFQPCDIHSKSSIQLFSFYFIYLPLFNRKLYLPSSGCQLFPLSIRAFLLGGVQSIVASRRKNVIIKMEKNPIAFKLQRFKKFY